MFRWITAGVMRAVVPHADERAVDPVVACQALELVQELVLTAGCAELERPTQADGLGDHRVDEVVESLETQGLEHQLDLGLTGSDVPVDEEIGWGEQLGRLHEWLLFAGWNRRSSRGRKGTDVPDSKKSGRSTPVGLGITRR